MGNLTGSINKPSMYQTIQIPQDYEYANNQSLSVMLNIFGGFFLNQNITKLLIRKHSLAVMLLKTWQSLSPY